MSGSKSFVSRRRSGRSVHRVRCLTSEVWEEPVSEVVTPRTRLWLSGSRGQLPLDEVRVERVSEVVSPRTRLWFSETRGNYLSTSAGDGGSRQISRLNLIGEADLSWRGFGEST